MSAIEGSSDSPCAIERRSARKTSLGRRARCVSSLKVSEPNSSVALRWAVDAAEAMVDYARETVTRADRERAGG